MDFFTPSGSIEIVLGPTTYAPRETINGKVKIRLSAPAKARSLVIEFYGEMERGSKYERVYRVSQELGNERTYKNGETFDFSLTVPENATPPEARGTFGALTDMFVPKPRNWYLEAKMDMPMAPDINARMSIYMRR